MRSRGFSLSEIANKFNVAKSTVSSWVKGIKLNDEAIARIEKRSEKGVQKALLTNKIKRENVLKEIELLTKLNIDSIHFDKNIHKLLCALLFWCEGEKRFSYVAFINSDPILTGTFLKLLRSSFEIDERKFRLCLHLHSYHNEEKQKKFWSKITGISQKQFYKVYKKNNGNKNVRENYPGCASIRYYDYKIALELGSIYKYFSRFN